jgi:AcrR family transcriptional regulator
MPRRSVRDASRGKGARTRARLIEAAHALFLEKGIAATALHEIAKRAGVTTGAIYGCFKNKDDLVLAVGQAKSVRLAPDLVAGRPIQAQMRAFGDALAVGAPAMSGLVAVVLEQQLHALRDTEVRKRAAERMHEDRERRTAFWRDGLQQTDLPLDAGDFVLVLDALVMGLMIHRAIAPELVPDRLLVAALDLLGGTRAPDSEDPTE